MAVLGVPPPPMVESGSDRHRLNRIRGLSKYRGSCFRCKAWGHHIDRSGGFPLCLEYSNQETVVLECHMLYVQGLIQNCYRAGGFSLEAASLFLWGWGKACLHLNLLRPYISFLRRVGYTEYNDDELSIATIAAANSVAKRCRYLMFSAHKAIGGGDVPDDTTLLCSRGADSALEFLSTCKLANLTVKAELGCCLLHRSGRLIIEDCNLQCESNPLDYLSYAIITTAGGCEAAFPSAAQRNGGCEALFPSAAERNGGCEVRASHKNGDSVSVSQTRIKGGAKAVLTSGTLALQRVRVIYGPSSILFWFDVVH